MTGTRADRIGSHRTELEKNREKILHSQRICAICGQPVDFSYKYPHPLSPSVDHIIPIAKGGHPSALSNLQLAHRWCNRQKSDKLVTLRFAEQKKAQDNEIDNDDLPQHYDWKNYKADKTGK